VGSTDFNATTSTIDGGTSGYAKADSPWSCAVWAKWDGAGEGSAGVFFAADTSALIFRLNGASTSIRVRQVTGSTSADIITSAPSFSTGVWYCLIATYDGPLGRCHLWYGTETDRMQECTYSTNTAANAAATTWAERVYVGSDSGAARTFDGRLLHAACLDWVMDRDEMERYRTGDLSVLFARGKPRLYFTLSDTHALVDSSRRGHVVVTANTAASSEMPRGVQFTFDKRPRRPL
jgi:hypothetical protein